jgi:ABC-type Fe3+ transport system permease subunit
MNHNDLLVGTVAGVLGVIILLAGALNWESAFRYRPARWIEASYGRVIARVFYVVLGLALIGLGIAISQGWVVNRTRSGGNTTHTTSLIR